MIASVPYSARGRAAGVVCAPPVIMLFVWWPMGRAAANPRGRVEHGWVRTALLGGILAGIISNVVLTFSRLLIGLTWSLIVWMLIGHWRPDFERIALGELWVALKIGAFPFVGERSLDGGFDEPIVALGLAARLAFSIISGALFGVLAHGHSRVVTYCLGMLFAISYWAASSHFVTPPVLESAGRFIEFVPYGLSLAITLLWYQGRFPRERQA